MLTFSKSIQKLKKYVFFYNFYRIYVNPRLFIMKSSMAGPSTKTGAFNCA